jgi:purine-nucleoside phosphorylase
LAVQALEVARHCDFICHRGVYVAVRGPNFETRAEYRMFRRLGGDVVGMSTVPEVLAAARLGLRVLAISTVTNVCLPDVLTATSSAAVLTAAQSAADKVRRLIGGLCRASADT